MQANYVVQDNLGNSGKSISFIKGESRQVTVWIFDPDTGIPLAIPGTIAAIVLKIFSNINQASIQKTLAASQVTQILQSGVNPGVIGFQFTLLAADTGNMAANNSGLPMTATFTDSGGNVTEIDFLSIFNVGVPVVQT